MKYSTKVKNKVKVIKAGFRCFNYKSSYEERIFRAVFLEKTELVLSSMIQ